MILFKNCNIITMDESMPLADYLVAEAGRIVALGSGDPSGKVNMDAIDQVVDLNGRTVVPGFWESHLHIVEGTRNIIELNLRGCNDMEDMRKRLADYKATLTEGDWIVGHGWDEKHLFGGRFPDRQLLDSLCSGHPMLLIRMDGHSLCINSKALEIMGTDWIVPSPEIPLGEDGLPEGMLYENSAYLAADFIRDNLSDSYLERIALKAQQLFVENGITSVNDINTAKPKHFDIYKRLYGEGRLKIRITAAPDGLSKESIQAFEDRKNDQTERLKVGPPKYFIDGSFGSRTALLFEGYADEPGNCGLELINNDELTEYIEDNARHKRAVNIHAIGDKAVAQILNAYERTGVDFHERNIRGRIEHIQIIREADIARFGENNITASFQPVFLYEKELTEARLGKVRLDRVYRFKSFMDSGVNVILNSDWPYGGGDFPNKPDGSCYIGFEPLLGLHSACCNQFNSSEGLNQLEALTCYTVNPAYVNHRETELGRLKSGYLADFAVLSDNITEGCPEEIVNAEVLMTVIGGEIVYKKE